VTTAAQPNITSVGTLSSLTVTANVAGGNITTVGQVSATGNVSGNFFIGNGSLLTGIAGGGGTPGGANTQIQFNDGGVFGGTAGLTFNKTTNAVATTGTFSATGNISGGNLTTVGQVTATGNVSGNFFIGNGSQLTGIAGGGTPNAIVNGTSNVSISSSGGNVTVGVAGTSNAAVFTAGSLFVNGPLSTPKTITANATLQANTNSVLFSPVTINSGVTITVPDSSTLQVIP
jgi:hypothetical protein